MLNLNNCHIPARPNTRESAIATAGQDLNQLSVKQISLKTGEVLSGRIHAELETVLVLLEGELTFNVGGTDYYMVRSSPFDDLPEALFLPAGCEWSITTTALRCSRVISCDVAIQNTGENTHSPLAICKGDITTLERGRGSYLRRINNIIGESFPARKLLCGETLNPPGNWSSYPPHKHDTDVPGLESVHEEVYVYSVAPSPGWGYQEIYSPKHGKSMVWRVKHGDACLIPFGYHPVVAAPDYSLHYFWVLAGESRKLMMNEDPHFSPSL